MERNSTDVINNLLHLGLTITVHLNEVKGYYGPGRTVMYLNRADCEDLARAFSALAEELCVPG